MENRNVTDFNVLCVTITFVLFFVILGIILK